MVPDQLRGELMKAVLPGIMDLLMCLSQPKPRFLIVPAALWFSGQPALELGYAGFGSSEMSRVGKGFAIGCDNEVVQADIDPNNAASFPKLGDLHIRTAQADKKFAGTGNENCGIQNAALYRLGDFGFYLPQLGELDIAVQDLDVGFRPVSWTAVPLGLEFRKASFLGLLEEILIRPIQILQRGLKGYGIRQF